MAIAMGFAFLAALGLSASYVLVRIVVQRIATPTITFFTTFSGAVLVAVLALTLNRPDMKGLEPGDFAWFALMAIIAYPLARMLNVTAISMVGASRAAPVASLQPIFALALGVTLLGERPSLLVAMGTPLVAGGLILVILTGSANGSTDTHAHRVRAENKTGYLLAMGAAFSFASRDVIARHVTGDIAHPMVTAAFALAIGSALLFALTYRDVVNSLRRLPGKYLAICGVAGICQGLATASLFQALSRAPVTVVTPISATFPLITLILIYLFLRRLETITPLLVVGTLLSIGGVVLVILGAEVN